MELLLRGRKMMRLLRERHPKMTLLTIGRIMICLIRMESLLFRGHHLRSKISRSWTHSKRILLLCDHLLYKSPDTEPALILLNTIA